jgi:hypothetical protein
VLPHWPRERYLELAPRYWSATRARLDPKELDRNSVAERQLDLPGVLPHQEMLPEGFT